MKILAIPAHASVKEGYPSKKWLFICCWFV